MATVLERLVVLTLAGIPLGVVVAGVGSRLLMLLLRVTSGPEVQGIRSDDGFVIGRFTLGGTYNLLALGATVGVIGVAAYQCVRPLLIGPSWFRDLTVAIASGTVVGSLLVHADGVDFTLLEPTWLTIGSFVALPALFGAVLGPTVRAVEQRASQPTRPTGAARIVPVALVVAFPPTVVPLAVAGVVLAAWTTANDQDALRRITRARLTTFAAQAACLAIALAGLAALVSDITDLA